MHGSHEESPTDLRFDSERTRGIFDYLVGSFIEDYMRKKYFVERSGWRGLVEVARAVKLSPSTLYRRHSRLDPTVANLVRNGFVETRVFPGERGRGGEVLRLRIAYERKPVGEYINRLVWTDARLFPKSGAVDQQSTDVTTPNPLTSAYALEREGTFREDETKNRLAVLPFTNMSPNPRDEFFAEGVAEEVISTVSRIPQLSVISRTSVMKYKHSPKNATEIGKELRVGRILEGSVRRSGKRVRISVQLLDSRTDEHLWTESYDRELGDILAIQRDIAESVANALKLKASKDQNKRVEEKTVISPDSYIMYLKGMKAWREEKLLRAIKYFDKAIKLEPEYAMAMAYEAHCYFHLGDPLKARELALKTMKLDDGIAETHVALAHVAFSLDSDWASSESHLKRAIEIDPNFSEAHIVYAVYLANFGRAEEALAEARRAQELDPLASFVHCLAGVTFYELGMYEQSIPEFDKALALDPTDPDTPTFKGSALIAMKKFDEGTTELEKACALSRGSPLYRARLAYGYSVSGRRTEALEILADLEDTVFEGPTPRAWSYHLALAYAGLGEKEDALSWLERAYEEHDIFKTPLLNIEPGFTCLRDEPRFERILKKLALQKQSDVSR